MAIALMGTDLPNGLTNYKLIAAATTNATTVKASAGKISGIILTNTSATIKYVKFYDKATAPTVGTDNPILIVGVPPTNSFSPDIPCGISFCSGISFAITGAPAVADTTAVALNDVIVNIQYA